MGRALRARRACERSDPGTSPGEESAEDAEGVGCPRWLVSEVLSSVKEGGRELGPARVSRRGA